MEQGIIEHYLNIIRRWLWLLVLAALIAGSTTYWLEMQRPPVYEAKVRLIVGPGIDSANPDLNALRTGGQLMQTYAELATMRSILRIVIEDLGLDMPATRLEDYIEVKPNAEAQILSISVRSDSRAGAVTIANAVAQTLVDLSPSRVDNPDADLKEQMRNQAAKVETNISMTEASIEQLESELQLTNNAETQRLLADQLSKERDYLSNVNRTLALLFDSLQEASTNQVKIVEPATKAKYVDPQFELKVGISTFAGLILGLVIVLTFEYFDGTVKSAEEFTKISSLPLLGTINRDKSLGSNDGKNLVVRTAAGSVTAENYRMVGTKLFSKTKLDPVREGVPKDHPASELDKSRVATNATSRLRSILISGVQPGDDVSEIAANLAVVLAQTGDRVILIDAHLRQPALSQLFDVSNQNGLTTALTDESKKFDLVSVEWVSTLSILPAGPATSDPFQLLASSHMTKLIKQLESQADLVVVAASPLLAYADSLILASRVDGVVVAAQSERTHRKMITNAVDSLDSLKAHVIGAIFDNRTSHSFVLPWRKARSGSSAKAVSKEQVSVFQKFIGKVTAPWKTAGSQNSSEIFVSDK